MALFGKVKFIAFMAAGSMDLAFLNKINLFIVENNYFLLTQEYKKKHVSTLLILDLRLWETQCSMEKSSMILFE